MSTLTKTDLTQYSDNELSLLVFNDEGLYKIRHNKFLMAIALDTLFIYTDEQYDQLVVDLEEDYEELHRDQ